MVAQEDTMTTAAERQARWNKSCADAAARGAQLENDPRFLEWIEEWIAGQITMRAVQERYVALIRRGKPGGGTANSSKSILEEIFCEVPDLAGLRQREPLDLHDTSDAIETAWSEAEERT